MKKHIIIILSMFILLISIVSAEQISFDGFESGTFCGGAGWSDSCWTTSGSTAIRGWANPYEGNRHVWLRSNTGVLSRAVDTTGYGTATVSFAVKVNSFEDSDRATFSIIVDGGSPILIEEWLPIDSDNTWHYVTYDVSEYIGNSLVVDFRSLMSDLGDEIHFDNIQVDGEFGVVSELSLLMEDNYIVSSNSQISLSSTETNTLHILELSYPNGTIFCEKTLLSPSISKTSFSTICELPEEQVIDAKAYFYVANDNTINISRFFNVLNFNNDPTLLKIEQVYFSEQVLQGGSTEIFALIYSSFNISNVKLELLFPDNITRIIPMYITSNPNEYRAFITDTYRVGINKFKIIAKTDIHYTEYNNQYEVVQYNLDFVQLVNQVSEVLNVKTVERLIEPSIEVHGTEYRALDPGRMFIQLLDGYNAPINDSDCYMSIYYPNNQRFKYKQKMSYVDEGLYYLDFIVPYMNGVYMASSYCIVEGTDLSPVNVYDGLEGGISGGTGWAGSWTLNGAVISTTTPYAGTYSLLQADDDDPTRSITGSSNYSSVTISFYHQTSDMENGEYYYVYIEDASGSDYQLLSVTDGNDDGVWKFRSVTLDSISDDFDFNGTFRFYVDSNDATEATDYLYLDEINLEFLEQVEVNETEYQVVRGSGEVHVTSDGEYTWELTQGELYYDNFYEGFRQYYDIISQVYVDTEEVQVTVPIYEPFPCDHVLNVQIYNETSMTWVNVTDVTYEYNLNGRNRCNVKFDMDLEPLETYQIRTDSENYWKQKILGDYQDNIFLNDLMEIACINYQVANGFANYTVPVLNASYENDTLYLSCLSFFNSFYHYEEHITTNFLPLISAEANFTTDQMNFLEASFVHIENIGQEVRQYGMTIAEGLNLGNAYSLSILADPYPPTNPDWALYFANISSSYLLYGFSNSLTPAQVWNYTNRNLTYYPPVSVDINYSIISNNVWNYSDRNLTYFPPQQDLTNYTKIVEDVWNWSGFINPNILGNVTEEVWNYVGKYIHGIIST